ARRSWEFGGCAGAKVCPQKRSADYGETYRCRHSSPPIARHREWNVLECLVTSAYVCPRADRDLFICSTACMTRSSREASQAARARCRGIPTRGYTNARVHEQMKRQDIRLEDVKKE